MARYCYTIQHVLEKLLCAANALSHAPTQEKEESSQELESEVESFTEATIANLPATKQQLEIYRESQAQDAICLQVLHYCKTEWPMKGDI